jgi:hypothetical protein
MCGEAGTHTRDIRSITRVGVILLRAPEKNERGAPDPPLDFEGEE